MKGNLSATSKNMKLTGKLWTVTFGTTMRGLGGLAVPNVTARPSADSVPIIVYYCIGLLFGSNMPIKVFAPVVAAVCF